ncbi:MAG: LURP-one-related family protein [Clostridia bacterium]|nr:LURP-one-related family protein [Clostridia bacterium]
MKLYIQQKIFTWGDKFSVYDGNGEEKYTVEGEILSFGKKLHLYDRQGNELVFIEQQLLTFLPKYLIYRGEHVIAEVVKEFTFFHTEYSVNGPGWLVQGDFWDHEYSVLDGDTVIASVSKEWFTLGDAYEISISAGADEIAALAVVLVIDACIEAQRD